MNPILRLLKRFFRTANSQEESRKLQGLRLEFRSRYHNFRALLQANNNALEQMAAMEKALADREPFGMPFVKATATAATVDVFRMIQNLEDLSPGRFSRLDQRFSDIKREIVAILSPRRTESASPLVMPFDNIGVGDATHVGSKMARLCEARNRLKLDVPDGFAITAETYRQLLANNELQVEINRRFQIVDFSRIEELQKVCEGVRNLILETEIPDNITEALLSEYEALQQRVGKNIKTALRSSAIGEDLIHTSFAGQYLSRLNVAPENLAQTYLEIVASKYSLQAVLYRYNCGLKDEDTAMCVGCMEMIPADTGGVVYSRDPIHTDSGHMIINAAWGLPKQVVDGSAGCDQVLVSRELPYHIIDYRLETKETHMTCSGNSGIQTCRTDPAVADKPSLTTRQASRLAHWALQLERHFGTAQDMEWAVVNQMDQIYLLQCRPLRQTIPERRVHQEGDASTNDDCLLVSGGVTASSGAGWGRVSLVDTVADIPGFLPGSVLVTRLALPCWAPLLDRAAAVVTELGGFAGHLGNVAREFGVPALFGIPEARKLLQDVESVTVDAGNNKIYKGRIAQLLTRSDARKNLIEGSPVYNTLKSVSRFIVPLNLLDPDSIEFRPENCRTLHDITRFIHEKSIQEIFNFGREFRFTEKIAKQLLHKVPMQWWVLNLDDGFHGEIDGRYVQLEEISCEAMHALWNGITAVYWEGPPRIDGRGLMSVMLQASTNRALNSTSRSGSAEKNYFMISRHFCSLTSRLGFHFTTVETIVGNDPDENYICFQYRGGAADHRRRFARVRFLGGILEENGFIVKVREDSLVARLEKREREVMISKLNIVGYLIMHSRQLDMVMQNSTFISHYREKFRRDISWILSIKDDVDTEKGRQPD